MPKRFSGVEQPSGPSQLTRPVYAERDKNARKYVVAFEGPAEELERPIPFRPKCDDSEVSALAG